MGLGVTAAQTQLSTSLPSFFPLGIYLLESVHPSQSFCAINEIGTVGPYK